MNGINYGETNSKKKFQLIGITTDRMTHFNRNVFSIIFKKKFFGPQRQRQQTNCRKCKKKKQKNDFTRILSAMFNGERATGERIDHNSHKIHSFRLFRLCRCVVSWCFYNSSLFIISLFFASLSLSLSLLSSLDVCTNTYAQTYKIPLRKETKWFFFFIKTIRNLAVKMALREREVKNRN